ncbi:E3 ubiquitin-protein ligase RFWD3 isoform X2 [Abrus precatorius]|uniref:RING-type E3 ubiquitin transferase n=1 Tax=Abrus precatorius TaxID=3816 RepID=A0A8B8L5M9_ABRPR|nr:E3 ubiquitin-protein ligase RFWD3 isoform X2 [Abrus precatorius]
MENPSELHHHDENDIAAAEYGVADEEENDDEEDEDEDDEEYVPAAWSSRVSHYASHSPITNEVIVIADESQNSVEEERNKRRRTEGGEASCSFASGSSDGSQGNEWNRTDIDGLICPICMDVWTNDGEHHICCLPCGHIYGMSCINKWLQQRRNSGKCPQCNRKCSLNDVRKLYASRVVAVDEESQKRIRGLEAKCVALESEGSDWHKKEARWQKTEAALRAQVQKLTERNTYLEQLLLDMQSRQSDLINGNGNSQWRCESEHNFGPNHHGGGSFRNFELQKVFHLDGARVFDMDISNQILLVAQKPKAIGGIHLLTKMSLISPFEMQDILLPSGTNGVKDLHISPSNSGLALYASFGKKLSVVSLDSSNPVINYDLQDPAWSCSWDLNSSHYIYAGLQNGSVLVFDMRQTAGPMKCLVGLTNNPVHTVQSLAQTSGFPSGVKTILSASAIGICQWNVDSEERPLMVPETDNQGVCISLAYCPSSDDIVGSYRPKFDMSMDVPLSQPSPTPYTTGQVVQGSHVLFNGMGSHRFQKVGSSYANVNKIRLPKCVIIDIENQSRFFASGDEVTCDLVLHELPSFRVLQQFKMPAQARDLRYSPSRGILGCLSENTLQLFKAKLS